MKIGKILILIIVLTCVTFLMTGCKLYTVVKHDKGSAQSGEKFYFDDGSFDADAYAVSIWESKVIPQMNKEAAEIKEVLSGIKADADATGKKYGYRSSDVGTSWNFIVKGKGKVIKVNTESRNGTLDIDLEPYDNSKDFNLQVGPVFRGTSIRDSLDFIKFDDFKNQLVFAGISSAFNKYVKEKVVNTLELDKLAGQEIEFVGTFTYESPDNVVVTPVIVQKVGGGK